MSRIIVLPEELQVIEARLKDIERALRKEQKHIEDPILDTEGVMTFINVCRKSVQN
jgi:hypothetical protein